MMERLLTREGMYNYRAFYAKNGVTEYSLISTRLPRVNSSVMSAIDIFATDKGKLFEKTRGEIIDLVYDEGKLSPVLSSLIVVSSGEKSKRRAV